MNIYSIIKFIKKQALLQPVVEKWFPFVCNIWLKYATGLTIRVMLWIFSKYAKEQLFDQYCNILYIEYMPYRLTMMCEYQTYIKSFMAWAVDAVNAILSEDSIRDDIREMRNELRTEMHEMRNELSGEMHEMRNELCTEINEIRDKLHVGINDIQEELTLIRGEINPNLIREKLICSDDLIHQ